MLMLGLAFILGSLELVNSLLELTESVLVVLLGLILLLLEEIKFAFPEGLFFL